MACAEMTYQVEMSKQVLVDPLPAAVKRNVIWRDTYWLPDEAASVYAKAQAVISAECAGCGDGDEDSIGIFRIEKDGMEAHATCAGLPFVRHKMFIDRVFVGYRRFSVMMFTESGRGVRGYEEDIVLLKDAPAPILKLGAKLTEYARKEINYLAVVRYENGRDGMDWHQHKEDKVPPGRDMSVYIVSTGAERDLAIREGTTIGGRFLPKEDGKITRIRAEQGSLIVLPSEYNNTHGHAVPTSQLRMGVRYAVNAKHVPPERNDA